MSLPGSRITLTAAPASGSTFAGWGGGVCTGTHQCKLTVNASQSVSATFNRSPAAGGPGQLLSAARLRAVLAAEISPSGRLATISALLERGGFTFAAFNLPEAGSAVLDWYASKAWKLTLVAAGRLSLARAGTARLRSS